MKDRYSQIMEALIHDRKIQRRAKRIVALLAVFVLLFTTDSLKMLAATLEWNEPDAAASSEYTEATEELEIPDSQGDAGEGYVEAESAPAADGTVDEADGEASEGEPAAAPVIEEVAVVAETDGEDETEDESEEIVADVELEDAEEDAEDMQDVSLDEVTDMDGEIEAQPEIVEAEPESQDLTAAVYAGKGMIVRISGAEGVTMPEGTVVVAQWVQDAARLASFRSVVCREIGIAEAPETLHFAFLTASLQNAGSFTQASGDVFVEVDLREPLHVGNTQSVQMFAITGGAARALPGSDYGVTLNGEYVTDFWYTVGQVGDVALVWETPAEPQPVVEPAEQPVVETPVVESAPEAAEAPVQAAEPVVEPAVANAAESNETTEETPAETETTEEETVQQDTSEVTEETEDETTEEETTEVEETEDNTEDETVEETNTEETEETETEENTEDETTEETEDETKTEGTEEATEETEDQNAEETEENTEDETTEETEEEESEETEDEKSEETDETEGEETDETKDEESEETDEETEETEDEETEETEDEESDETDEAAAGEAEEAPATAEITLDFSGYDSTAAIQDTTFQYDASDLSVKVSVDALESADTPAVEVTAENTEAVDVSSMEVANTTGDVQVVGGELVIAGDGTVELKNEADESLVINVTGVDSMTESTVTDAAETVKIDVLEGDVPLGAEATFEVHDEQKTTELVERHVAALESAEENRGHVAADVSIVRDNETVNARGQYVVTLSKASLNLPAGAKLDKLYHIHNGVTYVIDQFTETEDSLIFELNGFSDIVVSYTVDFTYTDAEGHEHFWQFPGTGSHKLSEVLHELGIEGEIEKAELELTGVVGETSKTALYLTQDEKTGEYFINSDEAFDDTYTLIVNTNTGNYTIIVTDESNPNPVTRKYYANVSIASNVSLPDYLYVVFKHTYESIHSTYPEKPNPEIKFETYSANKSSYSQEFNFSYDLAIENETIDIFLACGDQYNGYQSYMVDDGTHTSYRNGSTIDGQTVQIVVKNDTATITVGQNGPATYTARMDFYEAWATEKSDSVTLDSAAVSGYTITGTDADSNTYTLTVGTNGAVTIKNGSNETVDNMPAISSWNLSSGSTLGAYTVTAPEGPTEGVYVFTARKPEYYSASINFYEAGSETPEESPAVPAGYTLEASDGTDTYVATVTAGALSFTKNGTSVLGLPKDVTEWTWTLKNGDANADKIGEYVFTGPTKDDDAHSYVFTARKPVTCTAKITVDVASKLSGGNYYVVARRYDENIGFALFTGTTDPLVFTADGTTSVTLDDTVTFWIVKSQSALGNLTDIEAAEKLESSGTLDWYDYTLPTAAVEGVYTITATQQPEHSVSVQFKDENDVDTAPTLDSEHYYLVAKVNGERKYFANVTGNSDGLTFYDAAGNPTAIPAITSFELVKAASAASTLADLTNSQTVTAFKDADSTDNKEYRLGECETEGNKYVFEPQEYSSSTAVTHTTTIRFFDANAEVNDGKINPAASDEAVPDPTLQDYYYVLLTYNKVIYHDDSDSTTVTCWAVQPVNLKDMTTSTASVQFRQFKSTAADDDEIYQLTAGDYNISNFNTRLYHSSTQLTTDQFTYDGTTLSSTDGTTLSDSSEIEGYLIRGTVFDAVNHTSEVYIKKGVNDKKYKIRLRFDPDSTTGIQGKYNQGGQTSVYYYVLARVFHSTTENQYAYGYIDISDPTKLDVDDDGYYYYDYAFENWKEYNGSDSTDKFTGNEPRIEVFLVQSDYGNSGDKIFKPEEFFANKTGSSTETKSSYEVIYKDGQDYAGYTIHYDTRDSRGSTKYYTEKEGSFTWCIDQIDLISKNVAAEFDYTTILGPNMVYGIVAEHLYQPNHLQTNFAVNHFSGHGHDVRPDLSGSNSGNIVIGEFNVSDGSKRNSVGEVADDPTWGRLKVGKPLNGTLVVYADNDSGYFEGDIQANVYDNPNQTVVVPMDGATLSQNIVEPGIEYMQRMSAILASKPNTYRPTLTGKTLTINTLQYDEYATIYLDGDLLKEVIENPGGLTIEKKDHQTIVFNFTDKVNTKSLNITQFTVKQPSFAEYGYPNGYKTESPEATGSDQNKVMDDIARHIVWNLEACTSKVTIDTAGGIFLQPNDDSEIEIKGTTAGWIVSDGYVYNGTAEWHNVFEEMPDSVEVNLFALKYLDGKMPSSDKQYSFKLEKLVFDYDNSNGEVTNKDWEVLEAAANNSYSLVAFEPVRQDKLTLGWNIFRISEVGNVSGTITDSTVYYAAVYMDEIVTALQHVNDIHYTVTWPRYYTSFTEADFIPYDGSNRKPHKELTGVGGERVAIPTFENETVGSGLTLMKKVNGTDATNKDFTFKLEFWKENGTAPNVTMTALTDTEKNALVVTGARNVSFTTKSDHTEAEVVLRNGRKVTIDKIPKDVKYKITEVKIGNTPISAAAEGTHTVDGYTPVTMNEAKNEYSIYGEIENEEESYAETFINKYESSGEIGLNVTKTLKDEQNNKLNIVDDMFAFTITGGQAPITGYNLANGDISFPGMTAGKLSFDQTDMVGAVKDEDNHMVKEITLVIREGKGKLTQAQIDAYNAENDPDFSYEQVVYDDEKVITLVLTDLGDGTIDVKPKEGHDTTLTVDFNNKLVKKADATLEGTKTMEGRPMDKGEFMFNAKLIQVDGTDVSSAAIAAAAQAAAKANATNEEKDRPGVLQALRRQASPTDAIGVNEKVEEQENVTTYTSDITFQKIYYTAPGTYLYEITEDTDSMPIDAKPKTDGVKWYAKVEVVKVGDEMTATVKYSDAVDGTYAEYVPGTHDKFINETKKIGFKVTKEWKNASGAKVTGSKYITFSVTKDGVPVTVTGSMLKTVTQGRIEIVDGNVKLTSDASGDWPIAEFTEMTAGRYVIEEVDHSDVTGGSLRTTYSVLPGTTEKPNEPRNTNILRDNGETLTITNKETSDQYTNITVDKVWKIKDGGTYTPGDGSAKFELWEEKTTGSGSSETEDTNYKLGVLVKDGNTEVLKTGAEEVDAGDTIYIKYTAEVDDVNGAFDGLKMDGGNRADYKFYSIYNGSSFSGTDSDSERIVPTTPVTADKSKYSQGDKVVIEYRIPITNAKDRNGGNAAGMLVELHWQGWKNMHLETAKILPNKTTDESKVTTFTVSAPSWSWSSGSLPISKNDGEITWKYYIKEIEIPTGVTVTYDPAGTNGKSGLINTVGSASITATNESTELPKGALKITKQVTVNGKTTDGNAADGDYIFKVTGPSDGTSDGTSVTKYVKISVANGAVNSYKVADANDDNAWTAAKLKYAASAIVEDLAPGNYVVEELAPANSATLTKAERGDNVASAVSNDKVTVVVSANDTAAVQTDAHAIFTNNKTVELQPLKVLKRWMAGGSEYRPLYQGVTIQFKLVKTNGTTTTWVDEYGRETSTKLFTLTASDFCWVPESDLGNDAEIIKGLAESGKIATKTEGETTYYKIPYMRAFDELPKLSDGWKYMPVEMNSAGTDELRGSASNQASDQYWYCDDLGGIALKNNLETITAEKHWTDPQDGNTYIHPTITFKLYRTEVEILETDTNDNKELAKRIDAAKRVGNVESGPLLTYDTIKDLDGYTYLAGKDKTLTNGMTSVSWADLPCVNLDNGKRYVYIAVEDTTNITPYTYDGVTNNDNLWGFTNKLPTMNLYVKKHWKDAAGNVIEDSKIPDSLGSVTFKIMRVTYTDPNRTNVKNGTEAVDVTPSGQNTLPVVETKDGVTTKTWRRIITLPKMAYTSSGTEYYGYYVEEVSPTTYHVEYRQEDEKDGDNKIFHTAASEAMANMTKDADGLEIYNKIQDTEIEGAKIWAGATQDEDLGTVIFTLYANDVEIATAVVNGDTTDGAENAQTNQYIATEDTAWHAKWSNLPLQDTNGTITYRVEETAFGYGGIPYTVEKSGTTYTVSVGTVPAGKTATGFWAAGAATTGSTTTFTNTRYQTSLQLLKVRKDDTGLTNAALSGAVFKLEKDGVVPAINTNITTNADGLATIDDLTPGSYTLTETTPPAGYVITVKPIHFTVSDTGVVTYDDKTIDDNKSNTNNLLVEFTAPTETNATPQLKVGNVPGAQLPATGGSGSGAIYGAGAALVLLALVGWVMLNRKRWRGTGI